MRKVLVCLAVLVLSYAGARVAVGQTVEGMITGTVFDASGAAIPNATVTITNEGTDISQTRTAASDGVYRFPLVPPGTYTVTVTASGFAKNVTKGLVVEASLTVPLNVTMQVASATTTVEVSTRGGLVQTATSDLTETVESATIENIPLLTRNVYDLTFMAPQVSQGMDFRPATGGTRESGTQYMLNGADNNDNFSEGFNSITPPIESVREFTMLTNDMSAQYGRAAGAVISTSQKSGTNRFHGAAYEFNRNKSLNSSDFFSNRDSVPKPAYVRNNFGGEIDGPIKKDKTFFSFAYDQVILDTASYAQVTTPTATEIASMKAAAGPVASYYLNKYTPLAATFPCPNQLDSGVPFDAIGCTSVNDPQTQPAHNYFGRIDHNFSPKDRISFTVNINRSTVNDAIGGGWVTQTPVPYTDLEHYHNLTLVETHTFGGSLYNELTIAQNRHLSDYFQGKNGLATEPQLYVDNAANGYFTWGMGPYSESMIEDFTQDRWQLQDNMGWVHGRHSVKFGGSWQHGIVYRNWDLGGPGYYEFANDFGPTPAADGAVNPDGTIGVDGGTDYYDSNLVNEFPYFQEWSINPQVSGGQKANAYRHYVMNDGNLFVQDDWKVKPTFTLNLGLRWEHYGAPTEQHNIVAQFANFNCASSANNLPFAQCIANVRTGPTGSMWNTRNGDLGPRIGFAWDVRGNGRTAIRGGFGIFYDRIFDNVWSNGAWNPPYYGLIDWDATAGNFLYYSHPESLPNYVAGTLPGPAGRVSVRTMENNLKDSSSQNYYFGVEHQFAQNTLLRVNWQASLGRHLPILMNWNRYDGLGLNRTLSAVQPNSYYTGFNYRANGVTSNYNALVVELQKRVSRGLQFQASFTWSHLLDTDSDLFAGSTSQGGYSQPYYYISNDHTNLDYGNGAFDHRYSPKVSFSYELPVMRDQKGVAGKIIGGWQLTGFYQGYSGHPVEVYTGMHRSAARGAAVPDPEGAYCSPPDYTVCYDAGPRILDGNGNGINLGGDYNLDGVYNDHPTFLGSSFSSAYGNGSPADGIFKDNGRIGCGEVGIPSTVANIAPGPGAPAGTGLSCNEANGISTPNTLFGNPSGTGVRLGGLARNAFFGPWFNGLDAAMFKNFKISESTKLQIRVEAFNMPNHPNFDYINSNLNSGNFAKASALAGSAPSRRIQIGARFLF